jgi:mono/diheme cytochrome c family protein
MVTRKRTRITLLVVVGLLALLMAGCGNMREQPKLSEPYDESPLFGSAAREIEPNAVAVGYLQDDAHLYTGSVDGQYVETFPFEVTDEVMQNGQDKYNAFCTPCHGVGGYGEGIVVLEGLQQMRSFHDEELRAEPAGYYFDVITNGVQTEEGAQAMYSYASRIEPEDRWGVVAYIRALQLSQGATLDDLPQDLQDEFNAQTSQ